MSLYWETYKANIVDFQGKRYYLSEPEMNVLESFKTDAERLAYLEDE